ncbi:MAG: UDP-3-O-[3-hydroxymyristoyl] N-acetylglucosamine deacetylase [Planctomycetaceae bacterium]|nr:UDP-3-O-[3-hydroxymyristoyl] N-acetylglucosamine deacetylase [Planctomycetaceae bacterium]
MEAGAFQHTLAGEAELSGTGLFSGRPATIRLLPSAEDRGIVFRRVDLNGSPAVRAAIQNVTPTPRRTTLVASSGARVQTVEHLLAALAGLRIDNCVIEIDGDEVPAMDGSSLPFCEAILAAGIQAQGQPRRTLSFAQPMAAADDRAEQRIEVTPAAGAETSICYELDYGGVTALPAQSLQIQITPESFLRDIAGARTFVMESEVEALRQQGFGKHLTASDLVVFADDGTVIDNALRWPDEPVRHKILDCLGDLLLCGSPFAGNIVARRSGHQLNHVMAMVMSMSGADGQIRRAA